MRRLPSNDLPIKHRTNCAEGVVIYTLTGGIKATILTDYAHTIIIYAMILTGLFVVYTQTTLIGSPDAMFELLRAAAQRAPVSGNAGGEYLTMSSQSGVLLGGQYHAYIVNSRQMNTPPSCVHKITLYLQMALLRIHTFHHTITKLCTRSYTSHQLMNTNTSTDYSHIPY